MSFKKSAPSLSASPFARRCLRILTSAIFLGAVHGAQAQWVSYAVKQGFKQGGLLLRTESVEKILAQDNLDLRTEKFLRLSQDILRYAHDELGMNTGKSYRRFLDIHRSWVTQVIAAAPKDKLEPYLFHYPVIGDLPYKGFFDLDDALGEVKKLSAQNLDVYRRGVDAFSTLGWLPDPLLSSMFSSEARFIELLFHELTHLNFYFESAADFNEAFASWMGYQAALQYIATKPKWIGDVKAVREELIESNAFQTRFATQVRKITAYGKDFYAKPGAVAHRSDYFNWIRAELSQHQELERMAKADWNNALILSLSTYYEMVPAIEAFAQQKKLSPKNFLAYVVNQKSAVVSEILK